MAYAPVVSTKESQVHLILAAPIRSLKRDYVDVDGVRFPSFAGRHLLAGVDRGQIDVAGIAEQKRFDRDMQAVVDRIVELPETDHAR